MYEYRYMYEYKHGCKHKYEYKYCMSTGTRMSTGVCDCKAAWEWYCIIVRMAKTTKWLNAILDYMKKAKSSISMVFGQLGKLYIKKLIREI